MLPPASLLCVCSLLAAVAANPIRQLRHREPQTGHQQFFSTGKWMQHAPIMPQPHSSSHLDAAPNSVGMLFTNPDDDEVLHVWLPLGKRVHTRDSPDLPLHPVTARLTTMIRSTPQIATPEHLDRVVCRVYPHYNRTMQVQNPDALAIPIRKRNGLVRLVEVSERPWRKIEGYECS